MSNLLEFVVITGTVLSQILKVSINPLVSFLRLVLKEIIAEYAVVLGEPLEKLVISLNGYSIILKRLI